MAILFHCPYCTASVKVPDSAAGKLGECPKCATKIRIPTVEIPPPAAAPPVAPAMQPMPVVQMPTAQMPAATPPAGPESFDFSRLESGAPTSPAPKSAAARRAVVKEKSGDSSRMVGVGVMLALLLAVGIGGWQLYKNQPVYTVVATGSQAPTGQGIPVSVPWAAMNVESSRQPPVIEYFKRHQTAILSNILKIEIAASVNGLEIRAIPLEDAELIRIDPYANPDLTKYITANKAAWDATRQKVLAQHGKELCDKILDAQFKGSKVASISDYRDVVALNSLVHGLGRHVLAGSAGKMYPCIFEDKDGKLYFVVPTGTRDLMITEKTFEGQPPVLPSSFRLDVSITPRAGTAPPATPAAPAAETPPAETTAEPESKPASDPEMKTEQMKSPE